MQMFSFFKMQAKFLRNFVSVNFALERQQFILNRIIKTSYCIFLITKEQRCQLSKKHNVYLDIFTHDFVDFA